ncbi:MAG: hypothetical protein HKM28_05810, partial [Flavobacteriaceae bacterium]|nr:hypothetical protein [Flavobacteriaceae bacterium]
MKFLSDVKSAIASANLNDKIYEGANLTVEEQTHERGKPQAYLQYAADLLEDTGGKVIVEIGCMRRVLSHPIEEFNPRCCNDGHSTYFWGTTGAEVYSVDIDKKAVKSAKKSCKNLPNCKIQKKDGIGFLKSFPKSID